MKVGLDFDGTVTEDPLAFKGVVTSFLDAGHDVAIVTWRCRPEQKSGWDRESNGAWTDLEEVFAMWGFRLPVVYTNGQAKRDFYPANIWIEDNPAAIVFSLSREPRFVENAKDYDNDVMVCSNENGSFETTWKMLNPAYNSLLK